MGAGRSGLRSTHYSTTPSLQPAHSTTPLLHYSIPMPRRLLFSLLLLLVVAAGAAVTRRTARPASPARLRALAPPGMVLVPAGEFIQGTNDSDADEDARPQRRVYLPAFYIDRDLVTNAEFARFRPNFRFPAGEGNHPVTNLP